MFNMPVGQSAAPTMQYVTFIPQASPMIQNQQQAFSAQNYNYVYHAEQPIIQAPQP